MDFIKKYALYFVFIISLIGALISIYFSAILGWAPCVLCWYQRILLYPLVFISVVGILSKDSSAVVSRYILPFSVLGIFVALFHNLLYWGLITESLIPCREGVSCTADYLKIAGFVTIPLLSLIAFILITVLILIYKKNENK